MHDSDKENSYMQPCQNPLARKIFRTKQRKPDWESEVNTRLFEDITNQLDKLRIGMAERRQQLEEQYSAVVLENIKAYLNQIFTSKNAKSIETTVSFMGGDSKISSFQSIKQEVFKPQITKNKVKQQKLKRQSGQSVYQTILSENAVKHRKNRL